LWFRTNPSRSGAIWGACVRSRHALSRGSVGSLPNYLPFLRCCPRLTASYGDSRRSRRRRSARPTLITTWRCGRLARADAVSGARLRSPESGHERIHGNAASRQTSVWLALRTSRERPRRHSRDCSFRHGKAVMSAPSGRAVEIRPIRSSLAPGADACFSRILSALLDRRPLLRLALSERRIDPFDLLMALPTDRRGGRDGDRTMQ
jgi:hypothetical protein